MLHKNVIEKTNGFRELSAAELEFVSGGNYLVLGQRYGDIAAFLAAHGDGAGGLGGGNPFAALGGFTGIDLEGLQEYLQELVNEQPDISPEQLEDLAKNVLELLGAELEDLVAKYGDFEISFGENGPKFKASSLVDGFKFLGAADILVTGLSLAGDAYNDNLDVAEALGFLAAIAVTVGLSSAGAPAVGVVIAALLAEKGVEAILDGTAQELVNSLLDPVVDVAERVLIPLPDLLPPGNPNQTPLEQEADFWRNFFNPYSYPAHQY